jgi:DNA-binding CsgD family transcriptional regulator
MILRRGRCRGPARAPTVDATVAQARQFITRRSPGTRLTERELEILGLVAGGFSTPEIAVKLGIAPATVKTHLTSTYRKVGAKNRVQAARYYLDHHRSGA